MKTYLMLVTTMFFWGSAFVTSKMAVGVIPPSVAAFLRFGLGTFFSFLLLFFLYKRKSISSLTPSGNWKGMILLGIIGVALYNLLFFWGLAYSQASDGSMIIPTLSPVITVVLASIFFKEHFGRNRFFGLLFTLTGSGLFFSTIISFGEIQVNRLIGDLFFFMAACLWAIYTLMGRKILQAMDPLIATTYSMLIGLVVLLAYAFPEFHDVKWQTLGLEFWIIQLYLAIFPSVIAGWFYYLGVKRIGPSKAVMFMNIVPVSGLILSWIFLGESFQPIQFVGSGCLLIGVWMVNRTSKRTPDSVQQHKIAT